jgi:NTP pyrophosphatase (non-canonical NTP hydrolase)
MNGRGQANLKDLMTDSATTLEQLKQLTKTFCDERNWEHLNTPKNVSSSIAAEAGELMEIFTWIDGEQALKVLEENRMDVEHELADILMGLLAFAYMHNVDLAAAYERKLKLTALKYPAR